MFNLNFFPIIAACFIGVPFSTQFNLPKCNSNDIRCVKRTFTQIIRNGLPGLDIPPLNPLIPTGALSSVPLHTQDSKMGFTLNGVASKISILGLDQTNVQQINNFGPNFPNTNIDMTLFVPTLTFRSDNFSAKIIVYVVSQISANFIMKATVSSVTATVNFTNNVVQRNGKTYIEINAVKAKLNIGNVENIHVDSKELSPSIINFMNQALSKNGGSFFKEIKPDFDAYTGKIIQSLISSIVNNVAMEDLFVQ